MKNNLEKRMYVFVPYQLTGIQKGIQALHATSEYQKLFGRTPEYYDWVDNWKTVIILDGGTTGDNRDIHYGTLNEIRDAMVEMKVPFAWFREPNLNNALTAVCFICDERVFNKKHYPDWEDEVVSIGTPTDYERADTYSEWLGLIGGWKISMLRDLLSDKRLATN